MRKHIGFAALGVAFLASGCSGSSSSSPVVPAAGKANVAKTGPTTKAKLTIKVPVRKHVASAKVSPKYVSATTSGLYIQAGLLGGISSSTPWQSFNVSPATAKEPSPVTSQQCVPDPSGTFSTCTVTVTAPAVPGATDEFQIIATDWGPTPTQANAAPIGFIDSAVDDTGIGGAGEPIAVGAPNAINVSLEGVIGNLQASDVSVWAAPGTSTTFDSYIQAFDADWNPITGNPQAFANPIVLSDALGSLSPFTYPAPSTLTPPTSGSIYAQMSYSAPASSMAPVTTVNVTAALPAWLTAPATVNLQALQPATAFNIDPMTVNMLSQSSAKPIGSIDLSNGDVTILVNETELKTLTVTESSGTVTNPVVTNGSAQFTILASDTSTSITITDDRNTTATVPVGAPPVTTSAIHRARR